MFTVWYFDADPIGSTPEHVVTTDCFDNVFDAICARFGEHLFDYDTMLAQLEQPSGGEVFELPADTRVAVIKH